MNYKDFLKDKKITVVGLGADGEMCADIFFLTKLGAQVKVIEYRSQSRVQKYLDLLATWNVTDILVGSKAFEPGEDYCSPDLYLIASNISENIKYLVAARQKGVAVETSQTLFLKCAPPVTLVGVMGTSGKSTVAHLTYLMLRSRFVDHEQKLIYLDPARPQGYLPLLKKIKKGDVIILIIGTTLMSSLHAARVSPHVAVITNMGENTDNILSMLEFQTYNNFVIAPDEVIDRIKRAGVTSKAKMLRTGVSLIPGHWQLQIREYHSRENISLALRAAELFKVDDDHMRKVAEGFKNLKGRMEFVKKVKSVEFWNDCASTNLSSTTTALTQIGGNKNVVLILGGMGAPQALDIFIKMLPQYVSNIILLPGTGTSQIHIRLLDCEEIKVHYAHSVTEAVQIAEKNSRSHDMVLLSPGFKNIGSWKEIGDEFVKAVKGL